MLISLSIVAVLGIVWLVGSNIFLIFVIYRLNILGKAKDVAEFKYAVEDPEPAPEAPIITEIEAY